MHGEGLGVVRVKRKKEEKEEKETKSLDEMGLRCPKCGKVYRNNKGGWFSKHVESCQMGGGGEVVEVKFEGVKEEISSELKCPKCGKVYKSKAGGWYDKHTSKCGSSQDFVQ